MNKICVLMSTYNGEKYLKKQLNTVISQKDVDVSILIRDDGSTDNTINIIKDFKSDKITLIEGKNLGFAQSFWSLLSVDNDFDFYAFCDQDDLWMDDKIISAVEKLRSFNGPALYTSDVITIDEAENLIKRNAFGVNRTLNYKESLIKSVLPGCTFVFNKQLKENLLKYKGFMISHDWTTYAIANAIGNIYFDEKPHIYYRIHQNNTIGLNNNMNELKKKINRLINPKETRTRSRVADNIYNCLSDKMNDENKEITYLISSCSKSFVSAKKLMRYREYRNIDFIIALLLRRV